MRYRSRLVLGLSGAVLLAATGTLPATAQEKGGGEAAPVTMSLAVAEVIGTPVEPYVRAFVREVAARSDGSITIEPIWDAGAGTIRGFEEGVASLLLAGKADLALTAGRGWQAVGVTSLLPLQAPFLITDDASAIEVSRSPVGDELLAGMARAGVVGLVMWPEDLRHPVAFERCVEPLVTPEQFTGLTVRAAPSAITTDMMEALGATPVWPTDLVARVASCEIQAAESGLRQLNNLAGTPTLTADVTFFPKYQVLAANGQRFSDLSNERQAIIRDAAIAVRDEALADHQSDAQAAVGWCAAGGRVVLAGQDGVAQFERAARPVYERLTTDPEVERVVEEIRTLKDVVTPSAPAVACEPAPAADGPPVEVAASAHVPTITPEGSWRTTVTLDDIRAAGAHPSNGGTITLTFDDGSFDLTFAADSPGGAGSCDGTYEVVDAALRMDFNAPCDQYWIDVLWSETGDALMGQVVAWEFGSPPHPNDVAIIESHPWTRIE